MQRRWGCTPDLNVWFVLAAKPPKRTRKLLGAVSPRPEPHPRVLHGRTERLYCVAILRVATGNMTLTPGPSPARGRGVARSDGVRAFRRVRTGNTSRTEHIFCPPLNPAYAGTEVDIATALLCPTARGGCAILEEVVPRRMIATRWAAAPAARVYSSPMTIRS
jgi:hypothetical protein